MKKFKTIFTAIFLLLAMLLTGVACDTTDTETEKPTEEQNGTSSESGTLSESAKPTQKPNKVSYADRSYPLQSITSKLKMIGRMQKLTNGLSCDFTASGIAFKAYVEGDFSFTVDVTGQTTYFTVYVDGDRLPTRYEAKVGTNQVVEVGDLGDMALREIRILKQNQPQRSLCVLKTIDFYGSIVEAAEEKELFIEIIGDSITCGHGNLCANGTPGQATTLYEDGTQAYAFLTAELLDADYSIMGCSGIGVDSGWTWVNDEFREKDFYPLASFYRSKTQMYDFSKARTPDVVVINLGTNDKGCPQPSTKAGFQQYQNDLLDFIRQKYGDVPIVWAYGMMGDAYISYTQETLAARGGEAAGYYTVEFTPNGDGGEGHPVVSAHEAAAEKLSSFILNNVEFN